MLGKLLNSPALQAGIIYALGGLGFALGNIVLARALTPEAFAWIALTLAVSQMGYTIGPMGVDTLINRFPVNPGFELLACISASSLCAALVAGLLAWQIYGFPLLLILATVLICSTSSVNLVGSSFFRSRGKFVLALALTQGHNLVILGAGVVSLVAGATNENLALFMIAAAYVITATIGWAGSFRLEPLAHAVPALQLPWRDGILIVAAGIAVIFLIQVERLVIPKLLGTDYLATFAVLAAVAGSPYRVLQMGIGYTLLPRLRKANAASERKRIVKSEALVAVAMTIAASIAVWFITIPFVDWFLQGKYVLNATLIGAAILAGCAKVVAAFGTAGVSAMGSTSDLSRLNRYSWIAVGVSIAGAIVGVRIGLEGLLFGVASGWVVYALAASVISWPFLAHAKDSNVRPK